jgi:hypothetical protein
MPLQKWSHLWEPFLCQCIKQSYAQVFCGGWNGPTCDVLSMTFLTDRWAWCLWLLRSPWNHEILQVKGIQGSVSLLQKPDSSSLVKQSPSFSLICVGTRNLLIFYGT